MKKVMLINPPVYSTKGKKDINPYPPLGLAYLAAYIKDIAEIEVLDAFLEGQNRIIPDVYGRNQERIGLSILDILKRADDFKPDIIGITSMFSRNFEIVRTLCRHINGAFGGNIEVIIGGAHPTVVEFKKSFLYDYVVKGEGEAALKGIIEGQFDKFKGKSSRIKSRPLDMVKLKHPDWETVGLEKYFGSKMSHGYRRYERFAPVQTSRGCPFDCVYCTAKKIWGKKYRARSVEDIIMELIWLKSEYDIQEIMFEDDNLTLDERRTRDLFASMYQYDLDLKWDTPNGIYIGTLDENMIYAMVKSGCYNINFAIESGSQRVLNEVIKKPLNLSYAKEMVKYAQKMGVGVGIFLVVGIPGETKDDIRKTLELPFELGIYNPHISIATAYPGSELYSICREKGFLKNDYGYSDMHINTASISTPEWTAEEIVKMVNRNRLKRYFYAGMKEPIKTLKKIRRKLCRKQ